MGYSTIATYFKRRLAQFNFHECDSAFDFEKEGENYDNKYVMTNPETTLDDADTLFDRFYPDRRISVKIAKKLPEKNRFVDYQIFNNRLDFLIADLHNPTNFKTDSIRNVQYLGHIMEDQGAYVLAELTFNVEDQLSYAS